MQLLRVAADDLWDDGDTTSNVKVSKQIGKITTNKTQ